MDDTVRSLEWSHGRAEVQRLGGMLAPVVFSAAGAPAFSPLQVAPWAEEPAYARLGGLLGRLRGEWPCVPFGRCDRPAGLGGGWAMLQPHDPWGHGYASHHLWQWDDTASTSGRLALAIEPPASDPIARLERTVTAVPDRPELHVRLSIHARAATRLPVALHPTFSLGLGRTDLHVGGYRFGCTYPVPAEPGVSRLRADHRFESLEAVPLAGAEGVPDRLDLTRFPLAFDTEELLQLRDVSGPVRLDYRDAGWSVTLTWTQAQLPDLMLWVSHRGRRQAPWDGRHLALGLEPVNACFDLGRVAQAPAAHPFGDRAGLRLVPGSPTVIEYRLSAAPL